MANTAQKSDAPKELQNPYEGDPSARQINESVDEFLKRLPVLNHTFVGHWLWIANFASNGQTFDENLEGSNLTEFIKKGRALLQDYSAKKEELVEEFPNLAAGSITRKLGPEREKLKNDILKTATSCKVTVGKV